MKHPRERIILEHQTNGTDPVVSSLDRATGHKVANLMVLSHSRLARINILEQNKLSGLRVNFDFTFRKYCQVELHPPKKYIKKSEQGKK